VAGEHQFERDSKCYEQNCEQLRHLNQIMWQVPIVAMTLTGGLWYAIASIKGVGVLARSVVLIFSCIALSGLILMILRVRDVFGKYLEKVEAFNPDSFAKASEGGSRMPFLKDRSVVSIFSWLMGIAAGMSLMGAVLLLTGSWVIKP
jgi:hypothetical protein